ncbi:MAG: penicillin-binding transpeptidase domain-containing protein, partial [Patescibacteria group bacterium]
MFSRNKYYIKKQGGREIDDAVLTATEKDAAKIEWPLNKMTLNVLWLFMAAVLCILGARAFTLNVLNGEKYQDAAMRNSLRALVIPAPRGIIYDAYGKPLVYNVPSIDVVVTPVDVPQDEPTQEYIKSTLAEIGIDRSTLDQVFDQLNYRSTDLILLQEKISQEQALVILGKTRELPGISLYKTTNREYIDSTIFSHVLGYEGKIKKEELIDHPDYLMTDSIGKLGIEKTYEQYLRGKHGFQRAEVDALGNVKQELGTIPPVAGNDLILNIDADLQKKMYDSLARLLEERGLKQAAAVAIDPRSGAVRALVSLPSFDNNLFARGITTEEYQGLINDPGRPMFNRPVIGEYPPGSTIKPILAVAALTEGTITENTEIESKGGISIGSFFFGDWKVHGVTDLRRAIAVSSDVYFYSVGGGYGNIQGLGMEKMKKYESLFGWGEKTGIDLPTESKGLLPDPAWKKERIGERWYIGDDYNSSIGQGYVTTTPLQVLN